MLFGVVAPLPPSPETTCHAKTVYKTTSSPSPLGRLSILLSPHYYHFRLKLPTAEAQPLASNISQMPNPLPPRQRRFLKKNCRSDLSFLPIPRERAGLQNYQDIREQASPRDQHTRPPPELERLNRYRSKHLNFPTTNIAQIKKNCGHGIIFCISRIERTSRVQGRQRRTQKKLYRLFRVKAVGVAERDACDQLELLRQSGVFPKQL